MNVFKNFTHSTKGDVSMKNMKKKVLVIALCVCLLSTVSFGTLAWFTDSDFVTNDFNIANSADDPSEIFSVTVWEDATPEDVDGEDKLGSIVYENILPGDKLFKEVHIENTGSYDQYIRATVIVSDASVWQDVFGAYIVPLASFVETLDFDAIYATEAYYDAVTDSFIYELFYEAPLVPGAEIIVFDTVNIPETLDRYQAAELSGVFYVDVYADAVQTENVGDNVYEAFETVGLLTTVPCDVLATPDDIDEVLADAEPGTVIGLSAGEYDEIVLTQNELTIVAKGDATVGFINLNAKDGCSIIGVNFDAAKAQAVVDKDGKATGFYANIVGAKAGHIAADYASVIGCTFSGTPVDADAYSAINFSERGRKTESMNDLTVKFCSFEANAAYYIYTRYDHPGTLVYTHNTFGTDTAAAVYPIYIGNSKSDVIVEENIFMNWTGAAIFASGHSGVNKVSLDFVNNTAINTTIAAGESAYLIGAKWAYLNVNGTLLETDAVLSDVVVDGDFAYYYLNK